MTRPTTVKQTPEERAAKNRSNSAHSCGPKTAAGKGVVAGNAVKHGLRAEKLVTTIEDVEAVRELTAEWTDCYRPVTPGRRAVLDRCVFFQLQFVRSVAAVTQALDDQICLADLVHEREQQAIVAAHKARLADDPESAIGGLTETAAGCRYLIQEWGLLKSVLDEDGCWYAPTHRDRAIPPLLNPSRGRQSGGLLALADQSVRRARARPAHPGMVPGAGEHPRHAPAEHRPGLAGPRAMRTGAACSRG